MLQDIAMQIAALQEDSRGVAAIRAVPRASDEPMQDSHGVTAIRAMPRAFDQPMQSEEKRLQTLHDRMERVEKLLHKLLKLVTFAVFLLLYLVLAK